MSNSHPASFGGYDPPTPEYWYVYLLSCADGSCYVGCTSNLNDRMPDVAINLVLNLGEVINSLKVTGIR